MSFGNDDKGIISGANSTIIYGNHSLFNDKGIYLSDGSTGSLLELNQTYENNVGIQINNTSFGNLVFLNGSYANGLDMEDDNANCDTNLWTLNVFSTSNQNCIN
jgi:hypothetical protein